MTSFVALYDVLEAWEQFLLVFDPLMNGASVAIKFEH